MKGNDAFRKSQRDADARSNAIADELIRSNPIARGYYEAIRATQRHEPRCIIGGDETDKDLAPA